MNEAIKKMDNRLYCVEPIPPVCLLSQLYKVQREAYFNTKPKLIPLEIVPKIVSEGDLQISESTMIERKVSELLANLLNRYSSRAEAGKKIVLIETFQEAGFETNEEGFVLHLADNKTLKIMVSAI
jgi:hypothetical protein